MPARYTHEATQLLQHETPTSSLLICGRQTALTRTQSTTRFVVLCSSVHTRLASIIFWVNLNSDCLKSEADGINDAAGGSDCELLFVLMGGISNIYCRTIEMVSHFQ